MQFVTPQIFHLAQTRVMHDNAAKYLTFMGADKWSTDAPSEAELLVEIAGRRCYKSYGTELNPNLTRVREGNKEYMANILRTKHGSVIEHAYDTFAFENVSRVFTHEMVRHRLSSFSQESMRFVRPTALSTIFPQVYTDHLDAGKAAQVKKLFEKVYTDIEQIQQELVDLIGMDDPEMNFAVKKLFQSANRRLIPDGVTTGILVTANHRSWRHMIELRTSMAAEEEIRYVFAAVAEMMSAMYPNIYQDMEALGNTSIYGQTIHEYKFANQKI